MNKIEKCPYGGDIENDCYGCVYSGEYHYNKKENDCVKRGDLDEN